MYKCISIKDDLYRIAICYRECICHLVVFDIYNNRKWECSSKDKSEVSPNVLQNLDNSTRFEFEGETLKLMMKNQNFSLQRKDWTNEDTLIIETIRIQKTIVGPLEEISKNEVIE